MVSVGIAELALADHTAEATSHASSHATHAAHAAAKGVH